MKLGHTEQKVLGKGDEIRTRAGRRYRITRVVGSTVTVERIPTAIEILFRTLGTVAGVCRAAYRNARTSARLIVARRRWERMDGGR